MKQIQAGDSETLDTRLTIEECCERRHIGAYIDGELDHIEQLHFEQHAKQCAACAQDVAEQRCLLLMLDTTLSRISDIELPKNFAQTVTARAQADMSGVRQRIETHRAVHLCCLLAVGIGVLLGAGLIDALLIAPVSFFAVRLASILTVFVDVLLDLGTLLTVILRFISNRFVVADAPNGLSLLLLWCGFVGAFFLLLRSVSNYRAAAAAVAATSSLPVSKPIEISIS